MPPIHIPLRFDAAILSRIAIKDVSKRSGIVLDPFGGSGSTLVAAHKTGRRGYLAELDPIYVDCIIRRWQAYAKDDAILAPSGETFDEVAKKRREENARISLIPEHEIGDSQIVDHSDAPSPRKTSPPAVQRPGDIDTGYPTESIVVGGVRVGR